MTTKLDIVKAVATFVVGSGTTKIVAGVIKNNTNPDSVQDQVAIASAGFVIGTMAAQATKDYTDRSIDQIAATYHSLMAKKNATR
jgi:hypothetical protein